MSERRMGTVDVHPVSLDDGKTPHCPHGPTVVFERYKSDGVERFYGCSCSRDRKSCSFFQRVDEKVSDAVLKAREKRNRDMQPSISHQQYQQRAKEFAKLHVKRRIMCVDCGLLLLQGEESKHAAHRLRREISNAMLRSPTKLLEPLENNKTNAQYFFSENSLRFLVKMFGQQKYKKILCIGTPSIHEICADTESGVSSLLLDIDHRFGQFYGPDRFLRYNMFNHYFFEEESALETLQTFLRQDTGSVAVVLDPPYGGLVSLLSHTVKRITQLWKETNNTERNSVPVFWIFPYFMEPRISEALPEFTMLDYKIAYENHSSFKNNKEGNKKCKGSPVRIFTNIQSRLIPLPQDEGYRYCSMCERYVARENKHCELCRQCTSKDGTTYKHCDKCSRCVKPSRVHCDTCGQCEVAGHDCSMVKTLGCHVCGNLNHKRRDCPQKTASFAATNESIKRTAQTARSAAESNPKRKKPANSHRKKVASDFGKLKHTRKKRMEVKKKKVK